MTNIERNMVNLTSKYIKKEISFSDYDELFEKEIKKFKETQKTNFTIWELENIYEEISNFNHNKIINNLEIINKRKEMYK